MEPKELDLFSLAIRRWLVLVIGLILGAVVGIALASFLPKKYQGVVVMAPAAANGGGSAISGLLGQLRTLSPMASQFMLEGETSTDEYLAILESRTFYDSFARKRNLLPVLFPDRWDEDRGAWATSSDKQPSYADAASKLANDLVVVRQDPDTGLVRLTVTWTDPTLAAQWANDVANEVNELARRRATQEAQDALEYLQKELEGTTQLAIRDSLNALVEAQLQKSMLARVRSEFAFRIIDTAVAPESDDFVSPRQSLVTLFGVIAGFLVALSLVLLFERWQIARRTLQPC